MAISVDSASFTIVKIARSGWSLPHPGLQANVAEQLALSMPAEHAPSPNLVGANESQSRSAASAFFNSLLDLRELELVDRSI